MTDISAIENLVNRYVECWSRHRPQYAGLYEDNDFGCEGFQIFRSGFEIQEFSHGEASELAVLLTRSLRGQINADHKLLWSWCSFLALSLGDEARLFRDRDWVDAFRILVNLVLAGRRRFPAGSKPLDFETKSLEYVNYHLLAVHTDKWLLCGPLAYAALEGMLRRKSSHYVDNDGTVRKAFGLADPAGRKREFKLGSRLNRIDDSLRLFEQVVIADRGRPCSALGRLAKEILGLYPNTADAYDLIDSWRNDLVHGKEYWQNRAPIILNLICLLAIEEIEPDIYEGKRDESCRRLEWWQTVEPSRSARPWDIFPPDLHR